MQRVLWATGRARTGRRRVLPAALVGGVQSPTRIFKIHADLPLVGLLNFKTANVPSGPAISKIQKCNQGALTRGSEDQKRQWGQHTRSLEDPEVPMGTPQSHF